MWVDSIKHLGMFISNDLDDSVEISHFHKVNMLNCKYYMGNIDTKSVLFKSYCTAFYGSQLWRPDSKAFKSFKVSVNKGIRRLCGIPRHSHKNITYGIINCLKPDTYVYLRKCKLISSMLHSTNVIMQYIASRAIFNRDGYLGQSISYLCSEYELNCNDFLNHINVVLDKILESENIDEDTEIKLSLIRDIVDGNVLLTADEKQDLLWHLCTE